MHPFKSYRSETKSVTTHMIPCVDHVSPATQKIKHGGIFFLFHKWIDSDFLPRILHLLLITFALGCSFYFSESQDAIVRGENSFQQNPLNIFNTVAVNADFKEITL